jgi:hypothetical protein
MEKREKRFETQRREGRKEIWGMKELTRRQGEHAGSQKEGKKREGGTVGGSGDGADAEPGWLARPGRCHPVHLTMRP